MSRSALPRRDIDLLAPRFNRLLRVILGVALLGLALTEVQAQQIRMKSAQFDPLAGPVALKGLPSEKIAHAKASVAAVAGDEKQLAIVQWAGGVSTDKLAAFKKQGGELIAPIPPDAYLALIPAGQTPEGLAKAMAAGKTVRWAGAVAPEWKLDPRVAQRLDAQLQPATADASATARYIVQIARTGGKGEGLVRSTLKQQNGVIHSSWGSFESWSVEATPAQVEALARMNGVFWIEPLLGIKLLGERSGMSIANQVNSVGSDVQPKTVANYADWLNKVGLHGDGVVVQVMDDGLGQGTITPAHPDIAGRIVGIDDPFQLGGNSVGGHGHLNASIIMGRPIAGGSASSPGNMKDPGGYLLGQGVAPNAKVYATKILGDSGVGYFGTLNPLSYPLSMDALVARAVNNTNKAVISSNSWGGSAAGLYDANAQLFDRLTRDASRDASGFQQMIFAFAAGNDGNAGSGTIGTPASAKNVISVGAGENSDKGETDRSMVSSDGADDLRDIADFSSRGPLADGRFAPTLFAPGTHIVGAASDDRNFTGSGVSGRLQVQPGESSLAQKYYPAKQNAYTWSSGTSHACPAVAGALALLYEYYGKFYAQNHPAGEAKLTPALAKAMLVAGAVDTAGGNRNFLRTSNIEKLAPVPNNDAGWGRCSLSSLVEGTNNQFVSNQDPAKMLTYPGQAQTFYINVTNASKPLKIALSWTDAPGALNASKSLVNDLDLIVTCTVPSIPAINRTFNGNAFAGGWSVSGGAADSINNTECVFIKRPVPGVYKVTVVAKTLVADALDPITPSSGMLRQDFALFALNGKEVSNAPQLSFDQDYYRSGQSAIIALSDPTMASANSVKATVTSKRSDGTLLESEAVTLWQWPLNSGFFYATVPLVTSGAGVNGRLTVSSYSVLEVAYGGGSAKAIYDAGAPVMKSQQVTDLGLDKATIKIVTNEATNVTVNYGILPSQIILSHSSANASTTHEIPLSGLQENQSYFYDVVVTDLAGNTVVYNNPDVSNTPVHFSFTTMRRLAYYKPNFQTGTLCGWTPQAGSLAPNDWQAVKGVYPDRPDVYAWQTLDTKYPKDASLVSPPIDLKPGSILEFYQWYNFQQPGRTYAFDGGVVEVSTDNGLTWQDAGHNALPVSPFFVSNYDAYIAPTRIIADNTTMTSPLGGRMAWTGRSWDKIFPYNPGIVRSAEWNTSATTSKYTYRYPVRLDVSEFAGHTVKFRFRIGCNNDNVGGGRWLINDVQIYSPITAVSGLAQLKFDSPTFNGVPGNRIRFTLNDAGLSSASQITPSNFTIATSHFPNGRTSVWPADLKMIDPAGIWEGFLEVTSYGSDPNAVVAQTPDPLYNGDQIILSYADTNVGDGSRYVVSDTSTLDLTPPNLRSNDVLEVRDTDFKILLSADEPVTVTVRWGASIQQLTNAVTENKPGTSFTVVPTGLVANTPYYYTVTIRDLAGNVVTYDNCGYGFGVRTNQYNEVRNTLDPANASFAFTPDSAWTLSADGPYHSYSKAWHGACRSTVTDSSLVLDLSNFTILDGFTLRFWHRFNFELGLDGGVIEASRDGGKTWDDLGDNILAGRGYNSTISWQFASPISGRRAWSGNTNGAWDQVKVDLSPYAGSKLKIRFRLACDEVGNVANAGWHIDDLALDTYDPNTPGFPSKPVPSLPTNGLRGLPYTGTSLKWARSSLAQRYQVWFGTNAAALTKVGEVTQSASSTTENLFELATSKLIPGTQYYWRIVAVNASGLVPGDLRTFRTNIIDPTRFAQHIVGKQNLDSTEELPFADYNHNGKIDVGDLIANLKRR